MGWDGGLETALRWTLQPTGKCAGSDCAHPPGTSTGRGLVGFLCLYRRVLANRFDRGVILRMSFDKVRDCLSDGKLQGQRGPKGFPLPPERVMWEFGHSASRQLHSQVKGSWKAPHFLVFHRIKPGEKPI